MIDQYLNELNTRLHLRQKDRHRILLEVRDHLEDAVAQLQATDAQPDLAVERAIHAFGPAAELATQLNAEAGTRAVRRGVVIAFVAGVVVFAGFFVAATTQSPQRTGHGASPAVQGSFFLAALAFQVAVVAGARAASCVLALWRASAVRVADRQLVRRCAAICSGALGVAAVGWATCIGLAVRALPHPNEYTLTAGGIVMLGAAVIAIAALTRLVINPSDEASDTPDAGLGAFGLGEQAIELVQRHPIPACAGIAALAALSAMSHAEAPVTSALPFGALQAAAVVLGFMLLGPTLGLRRRRTT